MSSGAVKRWRRSSSARFALLFLLLFAATSSAFILFVYNSAIAHFDAQTDEWLTRETVRLSRSMSVADAAARAEHHDHNDYNHIRPFGVFDRAGRLIAGSPQVTLGATTEGVPFEIKARTARGLVELRAITRDFANGNRFLVAQDLQETHAFASDLVWAIFWGGLGLLVLGLLGSVMLASVQERRVRRLTQALHQIMAGRLGARLTPSRRRDELDDLTGEVNRMLDELQRLMLEVKSAGDNIAHDMRTPLTRLLAQLRQVDNGKADTPTLARAISDAVDEVSGMIAMFNALLRISEIEEGARREGFRPLDLARVVEDATDFHEVAAIERGITIRRALPDKLAFEGDADLLFEAVGNLVDNAIKYAPDGGEVVVGLAAGPVLTVADNGPGIPAAERSKVLARFHRVEASRSLPGNGLGLALVCAIARIHRLRFSIGDAAPGCVATLAAG
jgi:signal transduction histidine kinase